MVEKVMRTFETMDVSEYVSSADADAFTQGAIEELLIVANHRGLGRWAFSCIERVDDAPGRFLLHFTSRRHDEDTE